ncbi:T6SS phospholipase effector Tle1-like catalytic domain-containing protein [Paraburkholderia sacchari]|uniref:DUF2235 domain-containing protein n=1 Tax=Paraburkholderia sacchari TaxID=159450 RepID=A0A8T6ZCU2_9BURK|nr:DUF2235 domain-containing protein [Paraburkholderia sacchari]NLP62558.1 DUF2235 domain-containing protein [Paraburkholderia sacchari]
MLDDTQVPQAAGLRPLTLLEREARAASMACLDPTKRPGMADCSQSIWLSLFFDGTGNNLFNDTKKLKHSNVSRLFFAHESDNDVTSRYRIYINGLGTPFPEIGEHTYSKPGLAFGVGGEKRLLWARKQFDDRIEKAEARATNPKQPIRNINVALFGFSRGSALARAFAVRLAKECQNVGDGWQYRGHPIRLYFMGLFDTVASAGLPASFKLLDRSPMVKIATTAAFPTLSSTLALVPKDGHYYWAKDLKIPPMVEQCVHYVAAHEVRDSFPLDSVREGKSYPPNCVEIIYPGVHSDVGGGYAPGEQTRTLKDDEKLSQVPLLHMHRAARVAGVPLQAINLLDVDTRATFNLSPKTASLFDAYQTFAKASGPVENAVAEHLYPLYITRSHLSKLTNDEAAHARAPAAKHVLQQTGNGDLVKDVDKELARITAGGNAVNTASAEAETRKINGKSLSLREAMLARAYEDVSLITGSSEIRQTLLEFFDYIVHDSVAGFGSDASKLQNWRMIYFGDQGYEPANDWNVADANKPDEDADAIA